MERKDREWHEGDELPERQTRKEETPLVIFLHGRVVDEILNGERHERLPRLLRDRRKRGEE